MVNDSGTVINPLILDGQVQGGVAFGIGGALLEEVVYDEDGQPRNPNFMDYLLPGDENVPDDRRRAHGGPDATSTPTESRAAARAARSAPRRRSRTRSPTRSNPGRVTATPLTPDRVYAALNG